MRQGGFAAPKNQLKGGNADMMSKYGCRSLNSLALITHRVIQMYLLCKAPKLCNKASEKTQ